MLKLTREKYTATGFVSTPVWIAPEAIVTLWPSEAGSIITTAAIAFEVSEPPEIILAMVENARAADSLAVHERVLEAMQLLGEDETEMSRN